MTSPTAAYDCAEPLRTEAVRDATTVNGIDFLEVQPGQRKVDVHFLHPLPGQTGGLPTGGTTLNRTHFAIDGGDRVRDLHVVTTSTSGDTVTVTVSGPGDFSTYTLRVADPVTGDAPHGFDPRTSRIDFSFKAGCPIRFDCASVDDCPPPLDASQVADYLAKDYDSFRQLMLDRLATTMPDWQERNPADLQVALVELLAFVADRLSYEQDAVATEAYIGTARGRVSVRRHARLLGYRMHEGCAARTFVHVDVSHNVPIAQGSQFFTGDPDDAETVVFESLHAIAAKPEHDEIDLYTWTDEQCCLPRGATAATLVGETPLSLGIGDFLLLEEVAGAASGQPADADPTHRHVVRLTGVTTRSDPLDGTPVVEVTWSPDDALPFPFVVTSLTTNGGVRQHSVCGVARGNLVLVEHGESAPAPTMLSKTVDVANRWRPVLPGGRPTYSTAYDHTVPAVRQVVVDPRAALPLVSVTDGDRVYSPRWDLLASAPTAPDFVVETDEDGTARLRFGDGSYGVRPDPDVDHVVNGRQGHGSVGNIGPEAIIVIRPGDPSIRGVRNPLPAVGGVDPEPTEQVRVDAPHAFRVQRRAVTDADYGTITTQYVDGVQRAAGRMRWTGSWYTAFVTVDRTGGDRLDPAFTSGVKDVLDGYRMAGVDVEVSAPRPVPLEVELFVCALADRFNTDVEQDVLAVLSSRVLPDGRRGFFHPDNFTFGTPVYLSQLYATVLNVAGVDTVTATKFRRYAASDRGELAAGVLRVHDLEIAQLANDPDVPERGLLVVTMAGGR